MVLTLHIAPRLGGLALAELVLALAAAVLIAACGRHQGDRKNARVTEGENMLSSGPGTCVPDEFTYPGSAPIRPPGHRTIEWTGLTRQRSRRPCVPGGGASACPAGGPLTDTDHVVPGGTRGNERTSLLGGYVGKDLDVRHNLLAARTTGSA